MYDSISVCYFHLRHNSTISSYRDKKYDPRKRKTLVVENNNLLI